MTQVSPFDLLHRLNKTWVCPPGTCGEYASTGFEILGLALAEITGAHNWWDYDQFSVLPKKVKGNYNHTEFPIRGLCSKHPNIVHQYNAWWGEAKGWIPQPNESIKVNITDLDKDSCLNGWTCGNIAASPGDIARFHWDLHHGNIVSAESLKDMMHWTPMHVGWEPQLYGLAMMYETCEGFRFDIARQTQMSWCSSLSRIPNYADARNFDDVIHQRQTWPYQGRGWEPDPQNVKSPLHAVACECACESVCLCVCVCVCVCNYANAPTMPHGEKEVAYIAFLFLAHFFHYLCLPLLLHIFTTIAPMVSHHCDSSL